MRTLMLVMLLMLSIISVKAGITQLNTPMGPFRRGSTATITWNTDGDDNDETIVIEAVHETGQIIPIAEVTSAKSSTVWSIPKTAKPGTWIIRANGGEKPLFSGEFQSKYLFLLYNYEINSPLISCRW
jgi:hypothetical protein